MSNVLAIDGGGSHTRAGLYAADGALLAEGQAGPCNPVQSGLRQTLRVLAALTRDLERETRQPASAIVAGISGAGYGNYAQRIAQGLLERSNADRVVVCSDLLTIFHANTEPDDGTILIVAGTGSSVIAGGKAGLTILGGGGPLLDDDGSAYQIAIQGLHYAKYSEPLAAALAQAAGVDTLRDIPVWAARASKTDIAALAIAVLRLAEEGDDDAIHCVTFQTTGLAESAVEAARTANELMAADKTEFDGSVIYTGGLFENSPFFTEAIEQALRNELPRVAFAPAKFSGHAAAYVALSEGPLPEGAAEIHRTDATPLSTTEQRDPDRPSLDSLDAGGIAGAMAAEDLEAARAVAAAAEDISAVIAAAAHAIRNGGRLIYLGAGTSGRLGVLDASECPPTFGVDPGVVIGLIAGGDSALRSSVEGAEDDRDLGRADIEALNPPIADTDCVIGITASGTTPYVLAALHAAREAGATTALLCCNPKPPPAADHLIVLDTGPEILPGSTRLKAGTATKMALNQISTGAMALAGFVYDGYMVGVRPQNAKLRTRCIGILTALTGLDTHASERLLDLADGDIRVGVLMHRLELEAEPAKQRLEQNHGDLHAALDPS